MLHLASETALKQSVLIKKQVHSTLQVTSLLPELINIVLDFLFAAAQNERSEWLSLHASVSRHQPVLNFLVGFCGDASADQSSWTFGHYLQLVSASFKEWSCCMALGHVGLPPRPRKLFSHVLYQKQYVATVKVDCSRNGPYRFSERLSYQTSFEKAQEEFLHELANTFSRFCDTDIDPLRCIHYLSCQYTVGNTTKHCLYPRSLYIVPIYNSHHFNFFY